MNMFIIPFAQPLVKPALRSPLLAVRCRHKR